VRPKDITVSRLANGFRHSPIAAGTLAPVDTAALAREVKDRLKSAPPVYWSLRWTRMTVGDLVPPKQLPGVAGRIHANDSMIPKRVPAHVPGYVGSGKQIARMIAEHLAPGAPARSLAGLDFGCGYGRVLRQLVTEVPAVRWTAADVDRRAVRFCQHEFGVAGVVSTRHLTDVHFDDAPFDVVWMGSLLTHLPPTTAEDLWAMLQTNLRPGALLALSTHGPGLLSRIDEWVPGGSSQAERLARQLDIDGVAYAQYPHYRRGDYGIAFHHREAVVSKVAEVFGPRTALVSADEKGWLETQDLYLFRLGDR
jgi:SAM-dependent methyltransferase